MAQGGTNVAETSAAPVFTENRVEALRNHLRALMKALKIGYVDASTTGATPEQRVNANLLVDNFTRALEEVEEEYRNSIVTTDDVIFAANNLLSELQAYRTVLGERFPRMNTAAPSNGAGDATRVGAEAGETAAADATTTERPATAPETGVVLETSTKEGESTGVLSAMGEREMGAFALPQRRERRERRREQQRRRSTDWRRK